MPTYEYACSECGRHTEAVQSFSDEPLTVCPHCGGPLRKVFGAVGIVLKGSGFYKNDSRSSKHRSSTPSNSDSVASSSTSGADTSTSSNADSAGSASSDGAKPATSTPSSTSTTAS
jgi:putative FmdB family regulatory protein